MSSLAEEAGKPRRKPAGSSYELGANEVDLTRLAYLVIDDNRFARSFIRTALRQYGIKNVEEAPDAVIGFQILKDKRIDAVIVDIEMTTLTGIEFTRMVRWGKEVSNSELPIIVVSGHAMRENVVQAANAGAHAFVAKPFSPYVLYRHLWTSFNLPRPFIRSGTYVGPDRRSITVDPPADGERRG